VSSSPGAGATASSLLRGVVECGREIVRAEGDVDRVVGGFTAMESAVDATVEREVFEETVRRAPAARRGRGADGEVLVLALLCAPPLLLLIRAANALREGMRMLGLVASEPTFAGVELELIVARVEERGFRILHSPSQ
jgi:hypothetical protein